MSGQVQELVFRAARETPAASALEDEGKALDYAALAAAVNAAATALLAAGLGCGERVAIYLEKRVEHVVAIFGAAAAGGVFVPVNPLLKPDQVAHILADCGVAILLTSAERYAALAPALAGCPALRTVFLCGAPKPEPAPYAVRGWQAATEEAIGQHLPAHRRIDSDVAAILYTSGSTGKPKGVVLSHQNISAGAHSVAHYLELKPRDRILAVLPLSFDYGLNQLTSTFHAGGTVVLMNYLLPRDIVQAVARHAITGLAGVPPLWNQLAQQAWPPVPHLRFLTNSGGALAAATLDALLARLPATQAFLMYGLTEAFRSTYLPPAELRARPGSIGRAIPNAEVLVVRPDGSLCADDEPGELVHRGPLVAMGYWNDAERTAERFRPAPGQDPHLPLPEIAVWSGDTVRRDADGYLYFVGRNDEMIKVSGYRISPTEIESAVQGHEGIDEVCALGIADADLGQAVVLLVVARDGATLQADAVLKACRQRLPAYMVPKFLEIQHALFPRNPNGKIDRKTVRQRYLAQLQGVR